MKKILVTALTLILAMMMLTTACLGSSNKELNTADALNELGLFLGTGSGYDLEGGLTRGQGVTLLVRMIGMEDAANSGSWSNRFTDVPAWAAGYIGYAYENGITKGVSETKFDAEGAMTDYMFLTLTLRALGFSDSGENAQFTWDKPYELAQKIGLIEKAVADKQFLRADAITVFWNALDVKLNGSDMTLAERLIGQGVFSASDLEKARDIYENGRDGKTDAPSTPDVEEKPVEKPVDPKPEHTPDPKPDEGDYEVDEDGNTVIPNAGEWN